ncbi:exported hypothetical protein [Oceanicaulis sp. 350]|nr:exported hypothetical protein [Oceanicaulis sp. 350]
MKRIRSILGALVIGVSTMLAAPMAHAAQPGESDPVIFCIENYPDGYIVLVFVDGVQVRQFYSDTCPVLF